MAKLSPEEKLFRARIDIIKKIGRFIPGDSYYILNTGECIGDPADVVDDDVGESLVTLNEESLKLLCGEQISKYKAVKISDIALLKKEATNNDDFDAHICVPEPNSSDYSDFESDIEYVGCLKDIIMNNTDGWKHLSLTDEEKDSIFEKKEDISVSFSQDESIPPVLISKELFYNVKPEDVNNLIDYSVTDIGADDSHPVYCLVLFFRTSEYFTAYTIYYFI